MLLLDCYSEAVIYFIIDLPSTDRQQGIFNSIMKQSRCYKVFDCSSLIIELYSDTVLPIISDYFI
jgi:hypothetical protein